MPTSRGLRARALVPALLLALLLGVGRLAGAQEESPFSIEVGGVTGAALRVKARAFATIQVSVRNDSDRDVHGVLRAYRVDRPNSDTPAQGLFYEQEVELPRKGKRTETLYYYVQEGEPQNRLCVAFQPDEGVAPPLAYPPLVRSDALQVLVLAGNNVAEVVKRTLHGARVGSRFHAILSEAAIANLDALPDHPAGYESFDAVVLAEADLPPDRIPPLLDWVAAGGDLWVVASSGRSKVAPAIDAVLPVKRIAYKKLRIDTIQALAPRWPPMARGTEPVLVEQAELRPGGDVLLGSQQEPLIARGRHGAGYVTYLAFPLDAGPLDKWSGMHAVVGDLLRLPREDGDVDDGVPPDPPVEEVVLNLSEAIESLEPPSTWIVAPLLILYVALVSPLNFMLLSRMRRLALAQLTAGLVALLFGAVFYGIGVVYKGSESLITHIGLIETPAEPGQPGGVDVVTGFFSTDRGQTDAEGPEGALVGPLASRKSTSREARLRRKDGRVQLERVALDTWALRRFRSRRTERVGYIEVDLTLTADGIAGTIANHTDRDLRTPVLLLENGMLDLNDIPAKKTVQVNAVPTQRSEHPQIPHFVRTIKRDAGGSYTSHYGIGLQGISVTGNPYEGSDEQRLLAIWERRLLRVPRSPGALPALLVAMSDDDPGGVRVSGAAKVALQRSMVVHETRVKVGPVPPGLRRLPPRVFSYTTGDSGSWLPTSGTTGTPPILERSLASESPSTVAWRWQLPVSLDAPLAVDKLSFRWRTNPELRELDKDAVKLEYFRFDQGAWVSLGDLSKLDYSDGVALWPHRNTPERMEIPYMVHPQSGMLYLRLSNSGFKPITVNWITLDVSFPSPR
ncbi:MAG: hypothetical protein AB7N76_13045 [Planctomycetota bacterium]